MKTLIFLLLLLLASAVMGETHHYNPGQAHLLPGAFEQLKSGDRIVFERGVYRLDRGLKLVDLENVTIEGRGRVNLLVRNLDDAVIEIAGCTDVTVKGLRAAHEKPAEEYECEGPVIRVRNSQRVLVTQNSLNGCGSAGVHASGSKDVVVYQNRIYNNTYAAIWVNDSQVFVHDNHIFDNATALSTYGQCDITFTKNTIKHNSGNEYTGSRFFRRVVGDE